MSDIFHKLENYKPIVELLKKWDAFSSNINKKPVNMPIIIPDMIWKTPAGIGKTQLLNLIAEHLYEKNNIMPFYGDVKFFEFYLEYCEPGTPFKEIQRLMNEVQVAAGFRNEYCGIVHIDVNEWVYRSKEKHFLTFLEYLSENSDNWLIVLSMSKNKDTKEIEAIINSYLRIETIVIDMPETKEFVDVCCEYLSKYDIILLGDARNLLEKTIDRLKENKYFDGFKTVRRLCQDIVYDMYSRENEVKKLLTADDLKEFSSDSNYTSYILENAKIKIGFSLGDSDND